MRNHWLHIDKAEGMGFQLALWVCELTGLLTIPAAVLLIRRTERPDTVSIPRAPEVAMTVVGE